MHEVALSRMPAVSIEDAPADVMEDQAYLWVLALLNPDFNTYVIQQLHNPGQWSS